MKRFEFRLQPVLEQRERVEQEAQRRVADLERERLRLEDRLRGLQGRIIAAKEDLREQMAGEGANGGRVVVDLVRLQSTASLHLMAQARKTLLELAGVHKRLELARAELLKAMAARKAVTMLREKRLAEWKREEQRREAAEVDELVVMGHKARSAERS